MISLWWEIAIALQMAIATGMALGGLISLTIMWSV